LIISSKFPDFKAQKSTSISKESPLHEIFKRGCDGSVHFPPGFATVEKVVFNQFFKVSDEDQVFL
jgi:hypothetical protein